VALTRPGAILRALLLLGTFHGAVAAAQIGVELRPGREAAITGLGLALHGTSWWRHDRNKGKPLPAIALDQVPALDRVSTRQWSLPAHRSSNVLFGVATAASLATAIISQDGERPMVPVVLVLESGLLVSGLTNTVKELARRPRPYLYNPEVPTSAYHPGEDAVSFWSGHTANMAAITFSTAAIVQRSGASQGMRTATWIGAAATPALMGYLRVRAGRHFPTDVLTGYLVGAAVGLLVPYIHRPKATR